MINKNKLNIKAVSEIMGYLLIFSIIVTIISIAYVQIYPELQKQQENSAFYSMENTFILLQDVEKLVSDGVTYSKTVSLRISNGIMYVKPNFGYIKIVNNNSTTKYSYGAIVYESGQSKIILENGAVVEVFGNQCAFVSSPYAINSSNNFYISIVNLTGKESLFGLSQICFRYLNTAVNSYRGDVTITFDTPTSSCWVNYFNKTLGFVKVNNTTVYKNGVNVTIAVHNISVT